MNQSESDSYETAYEILHNIYEKHRRKYPGNPDSRQMCCMWSIYNLPDVIEGTKPFCDIENAFDIHIDEDDALELYDMNLDEAVKQIMIIKTSHRSCDV